MAIGWDKAIGQLELLAKEILEDREGKADLAASAAYAHAALIVRRCRDDEVP